MRDLLLHFGVGFVVSVAIVLLFAHRNKETDLRPGIPMAVAGMFPFLLGMAKEAYDLWYGPGTPEMADVTFTWAGGLFGMFAILIIDLFRTDKY
jgi:uncharacterized membrane protein